MSHKSQALVSASSWLEKQYLHWWKKEKKTALGKQDIFSIRTAAAGDDSDEEAHDEWLAEEAARQCAKMEGSVAERIPPHPFTASVLEAQARQQIVALGTNSGKSRSLLKQIGLLADEFGSEFTVFDRPIMFASEREKRRHTGLAFRPFTTLGFFERHPRRTAAITLGICIVPTKSQVTLTTREWMSADYHCYLLFALHPPANAPRGTPKILVVGDPNVSNLHRNATKMGQVLFSRTKTLLDSSSITEFWRNTPRDERNTKGCCLALVLEWMIEVIVKGVAGLAIERDERFCVTAIPGFLPMSK
ncbi:hypothetical protein C8R43DRAFT_942697 [Mycena crocata]|nr:hypothetical protein C8R43DRAFT_942697 [Mycena crocata]